MTDRDGNVPIGGPPPEAENPSASGDGESAEPPERASPQLTIDWIVDGGDWALFEPLASAVADAANAIAVYPVLAAHLPACATVAFTTDDAVRALNQSYRGIDKATNVLSFEAVPHPMGDGDQGPQFLGDVVLGDATLVREAGELGIPPRHHLVHLVVHGVLHLMGYDHETDIEAGVMEGLETSILAALEIPNPYA